MQTMPANNAEDRLKHPVDSLPNTETPSVEALILRDLEGMGGRLEKFRKLAKQADEVWITVVCCDSRVRLPEELVEIKAGETDHDGVEKTKKILFVPLVTIGSGAPSEKRFRKTKEVLLFWGVDAKKIRVLVTQHGDSDEIDGSEEGHISCGLRKVYDSFHDQFHKLSKLIRREAAKLKRDEDNPEFSIDHLTLDQMTEKLPRSMSEINRIHQETKIPTRLLLRAIFRNFGSNLDDNMDRVVQKMTGYVFSSNNEDIRGHCEVLSGVYDHQRKKIVNLESDDLPVDEIDFSQLDGFKIRENKYQDPEFIIVSFGKNVIPYPIDTLLPHICGKGSEFYQPPTDNAFRTRIITATVPMLLGAVAEASYAISHHNHPHEGDMNFRSLKSIVIICENNDYLKVVLEMINDKEFIDEYKEELVALGSPIEVVNLNVGDDGYPGRPTYHPVSLN